MNSRQIDWTYNINNQRQVTLDCGEWDRITAQVVAPVTGTLYVYGSIDGGMQQGVTAGGPQLATNFTAIQVTNLATGTAVTSITAAGLYKADVNSRYIRFGGGGVSVYKFITFETKPY